MKSLFKKIVFLSAFSVILNSAATGFSNYLPYKPDILSVSAEEVNIAEKFADVVNANYSTYSDLFDKNEISMFGFLDIDFDGVLEFFVHYSGYGSNHDATVRCFDIDIENNSLNMIFEVIEDDGSGCPFDVIDDIKIDESQNIFYFGHDDYGVATAYHGSTYCKFYLNGNSPVSEEICSEVYEFGNFSYYDKNDNEITEEEYTALKNSFTSLNLKYKFIDNQTYANMSNSEKITALIDSYNTFNYDNYTPVVIEQPNENSTAAWKSAYSEFLNLDNMKSGKFYLTYIDNDDIPELIYVSNNENGINIYKYSDGNVKSVDNCNFASSTIDMSVSYLEKGNSICVTNAKSNGKFHYLYTIENNELNKNGSIEFNYLNQDFAINGNTATEEECNERYNEYKISDMILIDREKMYDISEENIEQYINSVKYSEPTPNPEETEITTTSSETDNNSDEDNNNTNNISNNNTANNTNGNGSQSVSNASNSKAASNNNNITASPNTGDNSISLLLSTVLSAISIAYILRKKK